MSEEGVNFKLQELLDKQDLMYDLVNDLNLNVIGIASNLGTWMVDALAALEAISTATTDISLATGVAAGGPTTTLVGLLTILQAQTRCQQLACPPGPDDADGCVDPFVSFGMTASDDYTGRVFATWLIPDLTPGLSEGTFLTHDVENAQITHLATSGWKVYVQSNGAGSASVNPDGTRVIPTNRWVSADSFQDMAFNVPTGADIRVYICDPTGEPFVDCVTIDSVLGTYTGESPVGTVVFTEELHTIPFDVIPSAECATRGEYGSSPVASEGCNDVPCCVYNNNANGYKITFKSGSGPITVIYTSLTGDRGVQNLNSIDDFVSIPVDTSYITIFNSAVSSPATHPFSVEVCPTTPI